MSNEQKREPNVSATARALDRMRELGIDTETLNGTVNTAEFWATKHGMLPQVLEGKRVQMPADVLRVPGRVVRTHLRNTAKVAPRINPKHLVFRQAQLFHGWPIGAEMTEAKFLAAIDAPHKDETKVVCR